MSENSGSVNLRNQFVGEGETAEANPFARNQAVRNFSQLLDMALDEDDLHYIVTLQLDTLAANALPDVFPLDTRQLLQELRFCGIIDQGDGARHDRITLFLLMLNQLLLNHFRYGLRAIVEAPFQNHFVESFSQ